MAQEMQNGRSPDAVNGRRRPSAVVFPAWPAFDRSLIAEIDLERARWAEITALTEMLTLGERLAPGYFVDPDWSVKDLIGHLGMWLTEAETQLINIAARSYEPRELDVDRRKADALVALRDQPWDVVWTQANGARIWMLQAWFALREPSDAAIQWVRKAGAEHHGEHLDRLRAWVAELVEMRTRPPMDERDP
jgi:hypothetical protein